MFHNRDKKKKKKKLKVEFSLFVLNRKVKQ